MTRKGRSLKTAMLKLEGTGCRRGLASTRSASEKTREESTYLAHFTVLIFFVRFLAVLCIWPPACGKPLVMLLDRQTFVFLSSRPRVDDASFTLPASFRVSMSDCSGLHHPPRLAPSTSTQLQ